MVGVKRKPKVVYTTTTTPETKLSLGRRYLISEWDYDEIDKHKTLLTDEYELTASYPHYLEFRRTAYPHLVKDLTLFDIITKEREGHIILQGGT